MPCVESPIITVITLEVGDMLGNSSCVFSKLKDTVLHDHWVTIKNQKYTVSYSHYLRQSCLPKDALYVQGPIQNHVYLVWGVFFSLGQILIFLILTIS